MISEEEYERKYKESKTKMIGTRIVSKDPELRAFEDMVWKREIQAGKAMKRVGKAMKRAMRM